MYPSALCDPFTGVYDPLTVRWYGVCSLMVGDGMSKKSQEEILAELKAELAEKKKVKWIPVTEVLDMDVLESIIARMEAGQPFSMAKLATKPGDMMDGKTAKAIEEWEKLRGGDGKV